MRRVFPAVMGYFPGVAFNHEPPLQRRHENYRLAHRSDREPHMVTRYDVRDPELVTDSGLGRCSDHGTPGCQRLVVCSDSIWCVACEPELDPTGVT